jgi:phage tail-like protein
MANNDIYRAYNFRLDIQGVIAGYFTEVSGLSVKVEAIAYREGGGLPGVRKLPGRVDIGDITLRYGLTDSTYMWDWLMTAVDGKVERRNASVILMGTDGVTEVARWNLENAWVSEWRGAKLDAMGQQAAIERMTLVAETLERAAGVQAQAEDTTVA